MLKRMIVCALAGGIAAQIWGTISWMVLCYQSFDYREFKDVTPVATAVKTQAPESGIYMLPNYNSNHKDPKVRENWFKQAAVGPFAFMIIRPNGVNPNMGLPMLLGFLTNIVIAAGIYWLLSMTTITGFGRKVAFVSVAGGIGALYPHMANITWWHFPARFSLTCAADLFVLWAFAGVAMAFVHNKMVKT